MKVIFRFNGFEEKNCENIDLLIKNDPNILNVTAYKYLFKTNNIISNFNVRKITKLLLKVNSNSKYMNVSEVYNDYFNEHKYFDKERIDSFFEKIYSNLESILNSNEFNLDNGYEIEIPFVLVCDDFLYKYITAIRDDFNNHEAFKSFKKNRKST